MHQDLLQFPTCQTFSMTKNTGPRIMTFWSHLNWCLRHIDQKLPISQEHFWTIFFLLTEMIWATSNQKPTLSKRSSYEKRCFKLEGHLRHVTLPRVDHSKKEGKKRMNKRKKNDCHVMHLKNSIKSKRKSRKSNSNKKMFWKKWKNCNLFLLQGFALQFR